MDKQIDLIIDGDLDQVSGGGFFGRMILKLKMAICEDGSPLGRCMTPESAPAPQKVPFPYS
jgi:hypothetical protein